MQPPDTGLRHVVKVCHRGGAKCAAHVQVSNTRSGFALRDHFALLLHNGQILGPCRLTQHQHLLLQKWVRKNRQTLFNIWKNGDRMNPTQVTQALEPVAPYSRSNTPSRPQQIRTLLALLTEYWRLNPAVQLHELLERLVPGGALPLDGPNRDDAALIAALRAMPKQHQPHTSTDSPAAQRQKLVTVDTHLRQLHKTLLREYVDRASQLDRELNAGETPLIDYEVEVRLAYLAAETDPGFSDDADPTLATCAVFFPFDAEPQALNQALQAIDVDNYADPDASCPQGFLTHDAVSHTHGASPALGEAGLLRADRVWVDFVLTRQYCMELESGVFQKMPPQEPEPDTNVTR